MSERCSTNTLCLVHVTLLSTLFAASSCSAYTPNAPAASRYLREMGKLLRDPHLQAYAPAQTLEPKTERDTSTSSFEDNSPTSVYYPPQPPRNEPYERFSSESDLFDALNQHIEALDKQIKTSKTGRNDDDVVDDNLPQAELDYEYTTYDNAHTSTSGRSNNVVDDVDASLPQPELEYEYTTYDEANEPMPSSQIEYESPEADHYSIAYDDERTEYYYSSLPEEDNSYETHEYYETTEYYQSSEQPTYDDTEKYNTERYETEEPYDTIYTEYSEMELEYQQDDEYHNEQIEEASYVHYVPKDKVEELAIQKRKGIPQLPITNDPFQLLGLDYDNPPKTEKDIKRAFLKMAKKYHPDAVAADATPEEKDAASQEFTRINSAYRAVKEMLKQFEADKQFHDDLITTGGPGGSMYDRRTAHIRRPFSRVNGDFDSSSGHGSSAKHRTRDDLEASRSFWGGRKPNANQYGESRTPFRYRQDVGDSCHVGVSFPPFSNF
eukprot:scaffold2797_cov133-Skeletonema_dohrnii-CCMP3373.AAC.5